MEVSAEACHQGLPAKGGPGEQGPILPVLREDLGEPISCSEMGFLPLPNSSSSQLGLGV